MICEDDIPGDLTTTVTLELGETFSSTLFHDGCEDGVDVDYLKIDLEYGKRYLLTGNRDSSSLDVLLSRVEPRIQGDFPAYGTDRHAGFSRSSNTLRAITGGTHYLRISDGFPTFYEVTVEEIDASDEVPVDDFPLGFAAFDQLTDSVRRVPFRFETVVGREYVLGAYGADGQFQGTLPDPWIGVGDISSNQWFNDNGGVGRDGFLRFTAQTSVAFATVGGTGNGTFRLNIRQVDTVPAGPDTMQRLTPFEPVNDYIETANDIDWIRVRLEAGQWYRFGMDEEDFNYRRFTTILRDPQREVKAVLRPGAIADPRAGDGFYYFAEETGDHFLIARTTIATENGNYKYSVEPTAPPIDTLVQDSSELFGEVQRFALETGQSFPLSDVVREINQEVSVPNVEEYQVYATRGLFREDVEQAPQTIHTVAADDFPSWTHRFDGDNDTTDLLIRAKVGGVWTSWDRTPIFHRSSNSELISDSVWELTDEKPAVTWAFADSLPSYFSDTYTGFQESGGGTSISVERVARNASGLLEKVDGEADIQVFLADGVDGVVDAYAPGPDGGGDIVLNKEFFNASATVKLGTNEYLQLLRGFATALGLNELDDGDLTRSVMADLSNTPGGLPFTFMSHDERALESIYGVDITPSFNSRDARIFPGFGQRIFGQEVSGPNPDRILSVDLREQGQVQFSPDVVGYHGPEKETSRDSVFPSRRFVERGATLFGNSHNNQLDFNLVPSIAVGGWMDGRAGDDSLRGSVHANWYGYQFGHGHDTIRENAGSDPLVNPRDTLRMSGFDEFNISLDRLQFTKLTPESDQFGAVPSLRIEVLNEQNNVEGSVTIANQSRAIQRVETLEIYADSQRTDRISLPALFGQLANNLPTKFTNTAGESDALGTFVTPI